MPTENELKYVLKTNFEKSINEYKNSFAGKLFETLFIRQGYILSNKTACVRIRETNQKKYRLCFKQKTEKRLIEVEKNIPQRDFNELWEFCDCKLNKIRYNIFVEQKDGTKSYWSIDAYRDDKDKTYFLLAEHEMPEGQSQPTFIPKIIKDGLLFSVPKEDGRFSARKLSDVKYAVKLYKGIGG